MYFCKLGIIILGDCDFNTANAGLRWIIPDSSVLKSVRQSVVFGGQSYNDVSAHSLCHFAQFLKYTGLQYSIISQIRFSPDETDVHIRITTTDTRTDTLEKKIITKNYLVCLTSIDIPCWSAESVKLRPIRWFDQ